MHRYFLNNVHIFCIGNNPTATPGLPFLRHFLCLQLQLCPLFTCASPHSESFAGAWKQQKSSVSLSLLRLLLDIQESWGNEDNSSTSLFAHGTCFLTNVCPLIILRWRVSTHRLWNFFWKILFKIVHISTVYLEFLLCSRHAKHPSKRSTWFLIIFKYSLKTNNKKNREFNRKRITLDLYENVANYQDSFQVPPKLCKCLSAPEEKS